MENDELSRIQQRKSNLLPRTTIFRICTTVYTIHLFEQIYNSRSKKDTNLINKYEYHTFIYGFTMVLTLRKCNRPTSRHNN